MVSLFDQMNVKSVRGVTKARYTYSHLLLGVVARKYLAVSLYYSITHIMFSNRQSTFSPLSTLIPLPKYFDSEWSYAQYRIPTQSAHISLTAPPPKAPTADVVDEEKCVVGWIQAPSDESSNPNRSQDMEYQLVALTYTGGWYRLAMPPSTVTTVPSTLSSPRVTSPPPNIRAVSQRDRPRSSSGSSVTGRADKGKGRERDREKEGKESRSCVLKEFRRYGRWDGWG